MLSRAVAPLAGEGRCAAGAPQRASAGRPGTPRFRGTLAAGAAALLLAGCAEGPESGLLVSVEGFAGLVAADEPNAAVVGRDVLGNNGSAADAAVAMGLTLAATLPSRVGLGGGGTCLVWSDGDRLGDALVFPPVRGADGTVQPRLARAMALLHARYGTLRWEELVAPAENLARFGFIASRAFARDLEAARGRLAQDPELAALFQTEAGDWIEEGQRLRNVELASLLGGLRAQGGGYLHSPSLASRYAEAAAQAGVPMDPRAIRDAKAEFLIPLELAVGDSLLLLPPPRSSAGVAAGQMWRLLDRADWADAPPARQARLSAEAGLKALAARQVWIGADGLPVVEPQTLIGAESIREMAAAPPPPATGSDEPPFAAGFVVGDRRGNAVSCSFSLNGLFGRGRLASGLGVVLPAPPPETARNSAPLAVGLVADPDTGRLDQAITASGGEAGFQHLVQVLQRLVEAEAEAGAALRAPRLVWQGGRIIAEQGVELTEVEAAFPGVPLVRRPDVGLVNAFTCPQGLQQDGAQPCTVAADPRGFGLAERAQ